MLYFSLKFILQILKEKLKWTHNIFTIEDINTKKL